MKRLTAFILLLCMILACISCDNNDESISSESETESVSASESESGSKTEAESKSEVAIESASGEESSVESATESESTEGEGYESDSESESETEVITPLTEFGQYSSAISSVAESYDRLRQMASAKNTYGKGATCTESELSSTIKSANAIKNGGSILNYKNASKLMEHFLKNSGEDYEIDVEEFLNDENALKTRNEELNLALRACEALAVEGESINVFQKEEVVHHNLTGDWKFAVGSYFTSIEIKNLTVNGNIYSATIVYNVTDFYNWDFNDSNPVFTGLPAMIVGDVSPKDLHELHRAGKAQEFLSCGEISYTVSWFKGSSVSSIPAFNK